MHTQHRVVGLGDGSCHLRASADCEPELGLFTVIHRRAFEHQATKARASTTANGVEDHEALQSGAVVFQFSEAIEDQVDNLLSDIVLTKGVVRSILLATDQIFCMEELVNQSKQYPFSYTLIAPKPSKMSMSNKCFLSSGIRSVAFKKGLAASSDCIELEQFCRDCIELEQSCSLKVLTQESENRCCPSQGNCRTQTTKTDVTEIERVIELRQRRQM